MPDRKRIKRTKALVSKTYKSIYFNDYRFNGIAPYKDSQEVIDSIFPLPGKYPFAYEDAPYEFQVINRDESGLFGRLAKESDIQLAMVRIRDKASETEIDVDKYYFEYFTFFYIDFKQQSIAYINNKNIQRFASCFQEYLRQKTDFIPLSLGSVLIPDIGHHLARFKKISRATGLMSAAKATHAHSSIFKATGWDAVFKSIQIQVKFSGNTKDIAKQLTENSYRFSSLKADAENDKGILECVDIIERVFSRKSKIELTKIYDKDIEMIKGALIKSLSTPLLA